MNNFFQAGMIRSLIMASPVCIGLVMGTIGQSCAAELEFKPSLGVSEEINDNIYETSSNKRTDYITHVLPGATLHYLTPFWSWDGGYTFDYQKYARKSQNDQYTHDANLRGNVSLLNNFLFLDVSDTYHRVSLDVARDVTTESSLFLNQTDQNIAIVSPYLLWRLADKSTLKTGYSYTDTRYWGEGIEKREHGGFADFNYELTSKFSLSAGYDFARNEAMPVRYDKHDVYGGFKYQYGEKSSLFGKLGNTWQKFNEGENVRYLFWDVGIIHDFGIAVATLESNVQTTEDPLAVSTKMTNYIGKLDKTLQRGAVGLSSVYSEYVNTQTGARNQRKLSFSGNARYEVMESLVASLGATAERFYQTTFVTDSRYHLSATSGLRYTFNHDIILSLTYTYETYRNDLNNADETRDINRGIVEVKKIF